MIQDKKRLAVVGAIIVFLITMLWAIITAPKPPKLEDTAPPAKVMTYENNTISEVKDGKTVWELTAKYMEINLDDRSSQMQGIMGKFVDAKGEILTVTADEGIMDNGSKNINLKGNVVAGYSDGAELRCDEIAWLADESRVKATGNVRLTRGQMTATADQLDSYDLFSKFRLKGKAHIEMR